MQIDFQETLPARKKAFKIRVSKYFVDRENRIYGPLLEHAGFDEKYFTSPGHSYRWGTNGKMIGIAWFSRQENPYDLVAKFSYKRKKRNA